MSEIKKALRLRKAPTHQWLMLDETQELSLTSFQKLYKRVTDCGKIKGRSRR